MIRPVTINDAARIAEIYNYYVTDTIVTFEEETVSADEYGRRIESLTGQGFPWLVWESDSEITGYAYAGPFRHRIAYRFTVETAIYLDHENTGNGIGTKLYAALIDELRMGDYHMVMGLVSLPNEGSVKLHERLGFKKIGVLREVGWKFERWIDVGAWQMTLERE